MSALEALIGDLEGALAGTSSGHRDRTMARLADLFADEAPRLARPHVALFDGVLGTLAETITQAARASLSERLADIGNAPPRTVRRLAFDEDIVVARPVLTRSTVLVDGDLLTVARLHGTEHQVAISGRVRLSEAVTDVLAETRDEAVMRAVARNPGARLSPATRSALVDSCRDDDALGEILGLRHDFEADEADRLVMLLKEAARARILAALPAEDRPATSEAEIGAAYADASAAVAALLGERAPTEADLARFAAEELRGETVCALAELSGLQIGTIHRIFEQPGNDLLLVLAKAHDWSWRTVRLLLRLRDPSLAERHHFRQAEQTFDAIAAATAQRVMHVLAMRETVPGGAARRAAP